MRREPTVSGFSNNSVVKGITPTKEAANLYLIRQYPKPTCKTS